MFFSWSEEGCARCVSWSGDITLNGGQLSII
jgi:hypothetical protein